MKQEFVPLLQQFAQAPHIPRTPENDALFASLLECDLIYPTLGHCWALSQAGKLALASSVEPDRR